MKILESNLYTPGTKFTVTADVKENTFGAGSLGVMSYITSGDNDYEDVANASVIIIRRGKGGVPRINLNKLSIPVFNDKRMMDKDNYLPVGRRHYVHTEMVPYSHEDLLAIAPLDFLGWAAAYMKYLQYLASNIAKPKKQNIVPQDQNHVVTIINRLQEHFDHDRDSALVNFTTDMFRRAFIIEARKLESSLIKCVLVYKRKVASIVLNSARFMDYTNTEYYEVTDKEEAKNTIQFHEEKIKVIDEMAANKKKKAKKSKKGDF
jgi:hypothetical protein